MRVRCVTFDIAGTLARLASPQSKVYNKPLNDALRHYNLAVPPADVMKAAFRAANARTNKDLPNFGAAAGLSEREWWQQLVRATLVEAGFNLHPITFDLVFQRAYSSFGTAGTWAENSDALLAMSHAKTMGLVVGAVCNSYHRYVDNNLPALGLSEHLDFAVLSHQEDVAKPSGAIFDVAAHRAAHVWRLLHGGREQPLAPSEVVHVGSSLREDYLGAKRWGAAAALLFDPNGRHAAHEELCESDVMHSLAELPARLEALAADE